ncbi:cytochrome b [Aestuariivirga litoralis]|uniref:cytochrome b n=1 Tax=Aestuariivirga litoralis TaxID=2650924 RepID=UPI0018C68C21|nr:cytochrome b/b6 domain-containing protein [Aestuariivirga litoralis]MBG1231113.1 cytochrome b [Aestuariivirga litoralis]
MPAQAPAKLPVRRYHPVLVALHWLLAFLIIAQLAGGYFVVSRMPNTDPAKLDTLKIHMMLGMLVFLLMLIRFIVRLFTAHPGPTEDQTHGLGRLRTPVHLGLYLVVLLMVSSGWATGYLISEAYATPGATLPADLPMLPSRVFHAWTALVLFLVIVLHIAAAVKERISGDKSILARMGLGARR